jgi:hypothetical protein
LGSAPRSIEEFLVQMEGLLVPMRDADDELQHFHATYMRSTRAISEDVAHRAGTKRFLKEARMKVWHNARGLNMARRKGPEALAERIDEGEERSTARVADLRAPGQVLLRLAGGFGVLLPDSGPRGTERPRRHAGWPPPRG